MTMNPNERMQELNRSIRGQLQDGLSAWRKTAAALGPSALASFEQYEQAAHDLQMASSSAAARVRQLRADDLLPDAGRRRLIDETLADAAKKRDRARAQMRAARDVLAAKARASALPRLDPKREQAAREELRLLTDNAPDAAAVLLELAQRDDELAGVAVSSYGESMLRARGTPKAKDLHAVVQDVAVEAAAKSADPERQAAAAAVSALGQLDRATACAESVADAMLEDEGVELP